MNIFESLRADHDRQRELMEKLVQTHGDSGSRDQLFQLVKTELASHSAAEERCFYIPLMEDDLTQEKARHSISEHHELDELIEQLETTEYSSPGWLTVAKQLADKVHHHLNEEEHEVFQLAGKVLSEEQKQNLSGAYEKEMKAQRATAA